MDITIYDVIKGPKITEKAYKLNKSLKKLVLDVHMHANKALVAEALRKLFNVEVEKVGIVNLKGKNRRVGRYQVRGKDRKKAIVTLKSGKDIDLMSLAQSTAPVSE